MNDKIYLVTGANSGIGQVTARALAAEGAAVMMVCRDREKGEAARGEIVRETRNQNVELLLADFSDLNQIRRLAAEVKAKTPRLNALVNNAGAYNSERTLTADGYETTFGVNHLGYFLLTAELLDLLKSSAPSRVVNVASEAHRNAHIQFEDLNLKNGYGGWKAYTQSKLANILFTYELARRLEGTRVTANCMHPGVVNTNFLNGMRGVLGALARPFSIFMRTPEKGADTIIWLASSPEVEGDSGKYFVDRKPKQSNPESYDREVAARLWDVSEKMVSDMGAVPRA
jgi:NAD(P)-dependent dehydrogenase (short-subunit alcohol dehydrogenase family)